MSNKEIDLLQSAINAWTQRPTTSLDSVEERVHSQSKRIPGLCPSSSLKIFFTLVQRINPQQAEQGEEHNARFELCHNQTDFTETILSRERKTNIIEGFRFSKRTNGSN